MEPGATVPLYRKVNADLLAFQIHSCCLENPWNCVQTNHWIWRGNEKWWDLISKSFHFTKCHFWQATNICRGSRPKPRVSIKSNVVQQKMKGSVKKISDWRCRRLRFPPFRSRKEWRREGTKEKWTVHPSTSFPWRLTLRHCNRKRGKHLSLYSVENSDVFLLLGLWNLESNLTFTAMWIHSQFAQRQKSLNCEIGRQCLMKHWINGCPEMPRIFCEMLERSS